MRILAVTTNLRNLHTTTNRDKKHILCFIFIEIQETVIKCRSKEKSLHIVHRYMLKIV